MPVTGYDFSGYATKNNIRCADGRVIMPGAFKEQDHAVVPMVWQHDHMTPDNVLGHALLENRADGMYTYGFFNNTPSAINAKECVKNGDVKALSIYANKLKHHGNEVMHGVIREVSLVLAGANPGAYIDTVMVHSDDDDDTEDAYIKFVEPDNVLFHSDDEPEPVEEKTDEPEDALAHAEGNDEKKEDSMPATQPSASGSDKTVKDVIDTMNEEQKNVLYALVGMVAGEGDEEDDVKHNVFEGDDNMNALAHAEDFAEILRDAKRYGSLKESALQHGYDDISLDDVLQHDATYGMENIDYLFPDYKNVTNVPGFVSRDMSWVSKVMGAVSHTPFARIKTVFADITEDEARAKGYIKGKQKKEEVFTLLKRTTDPQTVYKKQKLDRDDVIDITDFDVVAWLKGEMRMMLDEELARAFLIGDGRLTSAEDKIQEAHIRPIWTDDDFYTIKAAFEVESTATDDDIAKAVIRAAIKARIDYKGSGNPTFYTTEEMLTNMLLLTDNEGRDLYDSVDKLAKKLRVKEIVTVEVMEGQTRTPSAGTLSGKTLTLRGIVVNLADYNVGADKGGSINLFDDFDIDYNQMKYLIETRCSGALIKPYSAIAVETYPKA